MELFDVISETFDTLWEIVKQLYPEGVDSFLV